MKRADPPSAEEIQALVDGELSPEAAQRVRSALAGNPAALAELDDCLQVAALAHEWQREAPARSGSGLAPVLPFRPRPRRLMVMTGSIALLGAAAAAVVMVVGGGGGGRARSGDAGEAFAGALAPRRGVAVRLSWAGADRHRPYDTMRASAQPATESLSFELLGRVERLRDARALSAAHLLVGNPTQAAQVLAAAPRSPDVNSDRAAIALVEGKPEDALLAAADALAGEPGHVQATWNRGLALEQLGLGLGAADAFAAVATRGEAGWADEAGKRAAGLRAESERRAADWKRAEAAAAGLVAGGEVDPAIVAAHPGLVRAALYDAIAAAASSQRVRALRPLAGSLDARFGGSHLVGLIDRVARADFHRRGPLAARYAALAARRMAAKDAQALVGALRAARQDDMLLGALLLASATPGRVDRPQLDEYVALARASHDPWFELLAEEQRAQIALIEEDLSVAQSVLDAAAARCEAGAIDVRCMRIYRLLTHTYASLHRPAAAQRALDRARRIARATGSYAFENGLLHYAHVVAGLRDDTSGSLLALSRAYLDEWSRHQQDCKATRLARETMAMALINRDRLADAEREMARGGADCEAPVTAHRAFVLAHLLRRGGDAAAVAALRKDIAGLRADPAATAGERAFLDHVEGRLLVDRSPGEGRALLRRAIESAAPLTDDDIDAVKARSYSYSVLAEAAAARNEPGEALDLLAEERGLPAPSRCALGASLEDASVFAARAADGKAIGARVEGPGPQPVPAAIRAALAGCPVVDVFARQPYYGRPDLLPPDMAWEFRTGAAAPATPPAPGRQVVVANIDPRPGLDLAPLQRIAPEPGTTLVEGAAATPARVLAEAADAAYIEIHAHGLLGGDESDTSLLVLAPEAGGSYALGGAEIRKARLRGAPVVVLAACNASAIGGAFHSTWGLADAFAGAGARAVIASPDPIQDADAPGFFAALRVRIAAGEPPAAALRQERTARTDPAERAWIDRLVVFR